jgi:hypothetical protein
MDELREDCSARCYSYCRGKLQGQPACSMNTCRGPQHPANYTVEALTPVDSMVCNPIEPVAPEHLTCGHLRSQMPEDAVVGILQVGV